MACSKCKKKQQREEILKEVEKTERVVKVFGLIILGLSLYGVFSLIYNLVT
jgi:hypothetical protein